MSRDPAKSSQTSRRFREWFRAWGPDLWALTYPETGYDEDNREVFADLLDRTRRRAGRRVRGFGEHRLTSLFLKEWLARHTRRNQRQSAEDRILLVSVFGLRWPLERLALVLRTGESNVRFRVFEALKRRSDVGVKDLATLGRDCARQDLYAVDVLLGLQWKDPFSFFDHTRFEAHEKECPRCKALLKNIRGIVEQLSRTQAPVMPSAVDEEVSARIEYASRWSGTGFMSAWPWLVRLPVQLALLFAVVYGMIALPYVGDIFPSFNGTRRAWVEKVWNSVKPEPQPAVVAQATPLPPLPGPFVETTAMLTPSAVPTQAPVVASAENETSSWFKRIADKVRSAVTIAKNEAPPASETPAPTAEPTPVEIATGKVTSTPKPTAVVVAAHTPLPQPTAAAPMIANLGAPVESASPSPVAATAAPALTAAKVASNPPAHFDERNFYQWGASSGGNLDGISQSVKDILGRYAVEGAGELELGAQYRGGRYFHFAIPAESYEAMTAEIEALGLKKFSRSISRSWRKTPLDKRRVVFLLVK